MESPEFIIIIMLSSALKVLRQNKESMLLSMVLLQQRLQIHRQVRTLGDDY